MTTNAPAAPATIDHYFVSVSPFVYMGMGYLREMAQRHGIAINHKPFDLMQVWEVSGSVPLNQRTTVRQRYRLIELQRLALHRGVKLNPHPAHFPTNPQLADRCVAALVAAGEDASGFLMRVGEALWSLNRQIADQEVIAELLEAEGFDAQAVLERAQSDEIEAIRQANTQAAIKADAIGAPTYVYKGEVFWGQDRLELLDAMIASGREAFSAL